MLPHVKLPTTRPSSSTGHFFAFVEPPFPLLEEEDNLIFEAAFFGFFVQLPRQGVGRMEMFESFEDTKGGSSVQETHISPGDSPTLIEEVVEVGEEEEGEEEEKEEDEDEEEKEEDKEDEEEEEERAPAGSAGGEGKEHEVRLVDPSTSPGMGDQGEALRSHSHPFPSINVGWDGENPCDTHLVVVLSDDDDLLGSESDTHHDPHGGPLPQAPSPVLAGHLGEATAKDEVEVSGLGPSYPWSLPALLLQLGSRGPRALSWILRRPAW